MLESANMQIDVENLNFHPLYIGQGFFQMHKVLRLGFLIFETQLTSIWYESFGFVFRSDRLRIVLMSVSKFLKTRLLELTNECSTSTFGKSESCRVGVELEEFTTLLGWSTWSSNDIYLQSWCLSTNLNPGIETLTMEKVQIPSCCHRTDDCTSESHDEPQRFKKVY